MLKLSATASTPAQESSMIFCTPNPNSKEYPFDPVCAKIVEALKIRDWKVPSITVSFLNYPLHSKYHQVSKIEAPDFTLSFFRPFNGGRSLDAPQPNVTNIYIPQRALSVYPDQSASLYLYKGNDWDRDRNTFLDTPSYCESIRYLNEEPSKSYCCCFRLGSPSLYFKPESKIQGGHGRCFTVKTSPLRGERPFHLVSEIHQEFTRYLEGVFARIEAFPVPASESASAAAASKEAEFKP